MEQDEQSTHNYKLNIVKDNKNIKIVAEVGSAEGFMALDLIDWVDKVYLFECDEEGIEALNKTFENYKHKVEIVKKYICATNNKDSITLDSFFEGKK